jgi:hypothetical protein
MRAAGQLGQHPARIVVVGRLAENASADRHRGVGGKNGRRRQAAMRKARGRGTRLGKRHPLHVTGRGFAGNDGLQGLGIFLRVGKQELEAYADLSEQLLSARTGGSEIDVAAGQG